MSRLQTARLRTGIDRISRTVPFYRKKLEEAGVTSADIRSLEDLERLPFTAKHDLHDHYPYGLLAVPLEQVVRIHASSGTTGKPTVVAYTRNDLDLWSDLMARTCAGAGVTSRDVIHNAYGYGLFTGGLGFHYGAEKLGAAVIPVSGGNTKRQLTLMRDLGSTVLGCTPSYALALAEAAREEDVDLCSLPLRIGLFGAEPWSGQMRQEIESRMGIVSLNVYGLSEVIGPGVGAHLRDEGSAAAGPLPYARSHAADTRKMRMWPHHNSHGPLAGPDRRYDYRARRKCLSVAD